VSDALTESLSRIWKEALGTTRVSPEENFFDLGGDSLAAITVVAAIYNEFSVEIPIRILFDNPTINEFSEALVEILGLDS